MVPRFWILLVGLAAGGGGELGMEGYELVGGGMEGWRDRGMGVWMGWGVWGIGGKGGIARS